MKKIPEIPVYKGVQIYENFGYYSCSLDRTIEERSLGKILKWIDKQFNVKPIIPIDNFIKENYLLSLPFLNN